MISTDIVSIVATYLSFLDCFLMRLTCKEYSTIKQNSITPFLIRKINSKMGFSEESNFGKELMQIIKKYQELSLGGSTLLEIINNENYEGSDIDIYFNYTNYNFKGNRNNDHIELYKSEAYEALMHLFKTFQLKIHSGFHITYKIDGYYVKKVSRSEPVASIGPVEPVEPVLPVAPVGPVVPLEPDTNYSHIEIIANPHDALNRVTKYRDFTFCNNYFDGKELYIESLDSIVNKWGTYDYDENVMKVMAFDMCGRPFDHVFRRALKYINRNFDVYFEIKACWALSDPDLYRKWSERKNINKIGECYSGINKYMDINEFNTTVSIFPVDTYFYFNKDKVIKLAIDEDYPDYVYVNTFKIKTGSYGEVHRDRIKNCDYSSSEEDEEKYFEPKDKYDFL